MKYACPGCGEAGVVVEEVVMVTYDGEGSALAMTIPTASPSLHTTGSCPTCRRTYRLTRFLVAERPEVVA